MSPQPDNDERLERFLQQALRDLPARPAPVAVEQRVLAELARRAALPWWRHSFAHWPFAARAVFLGACVATMIGSLTVLAGFDTLQFRAAFANWFGWAEKLLTVAQAISGSFEIVLRNVPSLWLYGSVAFFAVLYATLFGLGAAAYKALKSQQYFPGAADCSPSLQ